MAGSPGDYLVVEDKTKPTTWHLQVKKNGTPDHTLMGAAWAALHDGYRGNKYDGPNKQDALDKLTALYKAEKMPTPKALPYKAGARHSKTDHEHGAAALDNIQQAADHLKQAGFGEKAQPGDGTGGDATEKALALLSAAKAVPAGFDPGQYAAGEAWDAATAAQIIPQLAGLLSSEQYEQDADGVKLIQGLLTGLSKFIASELADMGEGLAADQAEPEPEDGTTAPAPVGTTMASLAANPLKSISSTDDELRVGNYILLFGGRDLSGMGYVGAERPLYRNPDGSHGERFAKTVAVESPYTAIGRLPVDWEHGLTEEAGRDDVLGYVDWSTKRIDDKGIFVERVLNRHADYVKWLEQLIEAGVIGTSSEAIPDKIKRLADGTITAWPLMRDTLTVTPAEPRMVTENVIAALKALKLKTSGISVGQRAPEGAPAAESPVPELTGESEMDNEAIKALVDSVATLSEQNKSLAAQNTELLAELRKPQLQPRKPEGEIVPLGDEKPFKRLGEQMLAIRAAATGDIKPEQANKLDAVKALNMKATGGSEMVQSEGGFLVQYDFANDIFQRAYTTGAVASRCAPQPISNASNGLRIPAVDEQSRADGSRFGGIQAYWAAEAATITKSKPVWRHVVLELKKLFAVVYGSDELLADAAAYEAFLMRVVPLEIQFKTEDAIINGIGNGIPLGVMKAPALVSVSKESGQASATIVFNNVVKMWSRMWAGGAGPAVMTGSGGSMGGAVWYVNQDTIPQLATIALPVGVGGLPAWLPPGGLSGSPYGTLFGRPVIPIEQCQTLGTTGDIILADMSQYALANKGGVNAQQSIHVQFLTDETTFRWTYRLDGAPLWNTALTPKNGSNTQSPFVALATR